MSSHAASSLAALNREIAAAPPLTKGADRALLGEGPLGAAIAFVGEQPGDQEDCEGRPFVGPAGRLLDHAMEEASTDPANVYVTNAVKHFKIEPRGKRRIHQKPNATDVNLYRDWLLRELHFVQPQVVVALGSTAALALAGKPDATAKHTAYAAFLRDLERIRALAA